jgi:ADP-ribose pyrophosphatase
MDTSFEDEIVYDQDYTKIILRHYRDRSGMEKVWGMVHMNGFGKGALVLACTEDGELILERSYRIPLKRMVIELPGGLNDIEDETPLNVAKRELLEETGYVADDYQEVAQFAEAPGVTDQETVLYLARNAKKVAEPALGASEEIEVLLVPQGEVQKFLKETDAVVDAKVYAALTFLSKQTN